MGEILQLDYYYGIEAEQFSFYRVPRLLIKDERFKKLSSDAKLLYGLMLDRMSLSMKNEWFDDENRAYIIYGVQKWKGKGNEQKRCEEIIACCYCCGNCGKNSKRHYESEKAERKYSC